MEFLRPDRMLHSKHRFKMSLGFTDTLLDRVIKYSLLASSFVVCTCDTGSSLTKKRPVMARTAAKVANILSDLYNETFSCDSESFSITWADLRGIAGVIKLYPIYLRNINKVLNKTGYLLIQFDNFLAVVRENEFFTVRLVPPRILEEYIYAEGDDVEPDFEDEDVEFVKDEVEKD